MSREPPSLKPVRKSWRCFSSASTVAGARPLGLSGRVLEESVRLEEVALHDHVGEGRRDAVGQAELELGTADAELEDEVAHEGLEVGLGQAVRVLDAPPHAAAVRPAVHRRQHVEQGGSRHARAERGIAGGEPVRPPVLPDHVERRPRTVEHDQAVDHDACPCAAYGARWCFTPARTASPCTLRRLTCTNAVRGSGAPMPSTIADESWLKAYVVEVRLMAAARMRSTGCARNGSRHAHASASTYTPRRRREDLPARTRRRTSFASRPASASWRAVDRVRAGLRIRRRWSAGTCQPSIETSTDARPAVGPMRLWTGADRRAAVDGCWSARRRCNAGLAAVPTLDASRVGTSTNPALQRVKAASGRGAAGVRRRRTRARRGRRRGCRRW